MHSKIIAAAALAALIGFAGSAAAGGYYDEGDRVYADSFGNLIVLSPAGYKRIVVGQGHLAQELAAYEDGYQAAPAHGSRAFHRYCYSKPTFWRGRSRMYGLPEGDIPQPRLICE